MLLAARRSRSVPRPARLSYNPCGREALDGPGRGVENEPHAHFLAIDTKMTFTVELASRALVKVTDMAPATLIWLHDNRAKDRKQAWNGLLKVCAPSRGQIRGKLFRWPERALDCNVACSLIGAPNCSGYS
jgi:hypothetical protein